MSGTAAVPDIIAITETSEHNDNSFTSNVSLNEFTLFSTPTNSKKGGTALYVNSSYQPYERFDLKLKSNTFECVWTEITNKNSKILSVDVSIGIQHMIWLISQHIWNLL